jgi:hypothetical protein
MDHGHIDRRQQAGHATAPARRARPVRQGGRSSNAAAEPPGSPQGLDLVQAGVVTKGLVAQGGLDPRAVLEAG